MKNRDFRYNARLFLHKIFHIYSSHFTSQFNFAQLVKWRSIKADVRFSLINSLRYLFFSSVRAVFGRSLPGFRSVADPRPSTLPRLLSPSNATNLFPEILQQLFRIQNHVSAMSSKYNTKQHISAQYCDKQMSEIWCKK